MIGSQAAEGAGGAALAVVIQPVAAGSEKPDNNVNGCRTGRVCPMSGKWAMKE
jgi:hypothetical protein